MKPATRTLHLALIRAAKHAIAAWEAWLSADATRPPVSNDPPRVDTHR